MHLSIKTKGCTLRRDEVLLIKKLGYEGWKQLKDAGRRWIAEIVFSSIKRVLGENLLSKKFKAQKVEAGLKVMLYNKFISLQSNNNLSQNEYRRVFQSS